MQQLYTTLIFICCFTLACNAPNKQPKLAPDEAIIHFEVTVNAKMADEDKIFITGNQKPLGEWMPNVIALTKQENDIWTADIRFKKGTDIAYKFTRGTWEAEAVSKEGIVPVDSKHKVTESTTLQYTIGNWKDIKHKVLGQITGTVKYHRNVKPEGLVERDVLVWLPPDYDKNPNQRYPVLYAHDAENLFDPKTSTLGRDWQLDELADSLIRNGIIEPIIIVGSNSTKDRSYEYSDHKLGKLYAKFVCNQLKPMIDKTYRTKKDRTNTATLGASMGGLISFILAWEYNDIFSKAACFSPAFAYKAEIDYVQEVLMYQGKKKDIELYIDNGTIGLEERLQPGIDYMMEELTRKKYEFVWVKDEGAEHNEIAWGKRAWQPLTMFFGI